MYDYSGYGNYHALQTSVSRRFDGGFSFTGFWVWSKALGINSTDFAAGVPNVSDAETRRLDYGLVDYDRPHNILLNGIYQMRSFTGNRALGYLINDWLISGSYQWLSGRPYAVNFNIPGIGAANLTGTDGNPNARIVLTCDPGRVTAATRIVRWQPVVLRAAAARQRWRRVGAVLRPEPAGQQSQPVDCETGADRRPEPVRIPRRHVQRAEPHQFTTVNDTVNFRSLTDPTITNLPYDANGNLTQRNGFGTISGGRAGTRVTDRDARDLLISLRGSRALLSSPSFQLPAFEPPAFFLTRPRGLSSLELQLC